MHWTKRASISAFKICLVTLEQRSDEDCAW